GKCTGKCTGKCRRCNYRSTEQGTSRTLALHRCYRRSRQDARINITVDYRLGEAVLGILPWVGVGMSPGGRGDLMHMTARAAHKSLPILLKLEDPTTPSSVLHQ
ncbi:MAG: hypothetical protein OSA98_09700, partial [Rubripirellula sp.]|nr:hypothetical protein [Rubripirellula sp.]